MKVDAFEGRGLSVLTCRVVVDRVFKTHGKLAKKGMFPAARRKPSYVD